MKNVLDGDLGHHKKTTNDKEVLRHRGGLPL